MRLPTDTGGEAEIREDVILAAAGAIYERRRKVHGGPPKKTFSCRWCRAQILGGAELEAHERACTQRHGPLPFPDVELAALEWPGPGGDAV
jgi:hypothetical protein